MEFFNKTLRIFSRKKSTNENSVTLIASFLKLPEHVWISRDHLFRNRLLHFLAEIPFQELEKILQQKKLLFLYCNQKMSCSFSQYHGRNTILVFPDFYKLLTSSQYHIAYGILAHEFGHVTQDHSHRNISTQEAQIEADRYAMNLGFGEELRLALLAEDQTDSSVQERIQKISFSLL